MSANAEIMTLLGDMVDQLVKSEVQKPRAEPEVLLLKPKKAAEKLGLPYSRVRYPYLNDETFPAFKIGEGYWVNMALAEKWVDDQLKN